jgi:flagellar capping protein FliD
MDGLNQSRIRVFPNATLVVTRLDSLKTVDYRSSSFDIGASTGQPGEIMAAIQSLGIGSGILTTELVEDLVAAEREPSELRLNLQQAEYEAEISGFGAITSALESLRTSTSALTAKGALESIVATSSDTTALTATASGQAETGSFSVSIDQLAQSHSLVTGSYDAITDIVGTGELTFRFGETAFSIGDGSYESFESDTTKNTKTITIDSSNNTLSSLRAAINEADFGVQATIVNDGSGFRLLLSTDDPGLSNSMEVLVAGDQGSGLKDLAYNATYNGTAEVGAIAEGGSVDLNTGLDFGTTNAAFTFNVGAFTDLNVTVVDDATTDLGGGGGTAEDNRIAIQNALDTALVGAGLSAGVVVASIDPDDGGLVLTTLGTGSDETLEVTADDGVLGLNPNLGIRYGSNGSLTQTQAAQSAELVVNGLAITRESNVVTEVISGVTLNLTAANPGQNIALNFSADTSSIVTKVQTFIDSFNDLKVISGELTAFNAETGETGVLLGDSTLRNVNTKIRNLMNSIVAGIVDSNFRTLAEVGIRTNQDNSFLLELDTTALNKAIKDNPDAIVSLFATNTSNSDPLIEVVNTGFNTQPGAYAIELTQVATQGAYAGETIAALDSPVVIDADNDTFVVSVNGTDSESISITQGTYTSGAALALELQIRINNDTNIDNSGDTITVSYDADAQRLEFLSGEFGSDSSISFSSEDTNTETQLGFGSSVGTVSAGLDVKGTINGEAATGSGQYLRASDGALSAKPGFVSSSFLNDVNVPITITPAEITNGDYDFKINVDGIASGDLTVAAGTYNTGSELAAALQTAINEDSVIAAANKSVSVDFDLGLSTYGVISSTTGSSSSVNFTEVSPNIASQLGFAIGGGVAGTAATGQLSEAAGIRIRVLGGTLGDRGTVSYVEGVAFQLTELFDDMLASNGLLETKTGSLTDLLDGVAESRIALDERLEILQNSLSSQFSAADGLISRLKSTEDFLSQQLAILSSFYTNDR